MLKLHHCTVRARSTGTASVIAPCARCSPSPGVAPQPQKLLALATNGNLLGLCSGLLVTDANDVQAVRGPPPHPQTRRTRRALGCRPLVGRPSMLCANTSAASPH